jgi:hypothetical protein
MFKTGVFKKTCSESFPSLIYTALISGLFISLVYYLLELLGGSTLRLEINGLLVANLWLGVLISLRSALKLNESWGWLPPVVMVLSTIFILLNYVAIGTYLSVVASMLLYFVVIRLLQIEVRLFNLIQVVAAASFLIANILFQHEYPVNKIIIWWIGFPLLTICGEYFIAEKKKREELILFSLISMWLSGAVLTYLHPAGWNIVFYILCIQSMWLLRRGLRTFKIDELNTYFSSLYNIAAYFWLAVSSLFGLFLDYPENLFSKTHLFEISFVGFVFNILFAHWGKLFSFSKKIELPFYNYQFIPFLLLQVTLATSVAGNVFDILMLSTFGRYGVILSLIFYLAVSLIGVLKLLMDKTSDKNSVVDLR